MKKIVVGPWVWENNYLTLRILLFFFFSVIHMYITFKVVDDIKVAFIANILISWSANFITSGSPYKTNSLLHCVTNLSHCVVNCLPFDLKLLENRVGKKIINDFSNFRERRNISKCVLFSWSECSKQNCSCSVYSSHLWYQFQLFAAFFRLIEFDLAIRPVCSRKW